MGLNGSKMGYRIIRLKPKSPASEISNVEEMLDFLLYPSDNSNDSEISFDNYMSNNENKEIELTFFNIASQKEHKCKFIPRKWEGSDLHGFVFNEEDYKDAHTRVIHVLDVFVGSPMYNAGFQSNTDYILGTTHYIFKDIQDFSEYVSLHQNKSIELVVYNSKEGKTKALALTPNPKWGGPDHLEEILDLAIFIRCL